MIVVEQDAASRLALEELGPNVRTLIAFHDDHSDMYSIHLWWEPSHTDFSQCHKGLLTEAFIFEIAP